MPIPLGILAAAGFSPAVAGGSYDLLETTVLGSNAASVTFSNLNTYASTYQHLQLRMTLRSNASGGFTGSPGIRLNGDTGSNFSSHYLNGSGSSVTSVAFTSQSYMFSLQMPASSASSGHFGAAVVDLLDPFETTKNKTIRWLSGSATDNIRLGSGAWLNTASLTSILIDNRDGQNWVTGSRFSLYGVK